MLLLVLLAVGGFVAGYVLHDKVQAKLVAIKALL